MGGPDAVRADRAGNGNGALGPTRGRLGHKYPSIQGRPHSQSIPEHPVIHAIYIRLAWPFSFQVSRTVYII